jgi:hypothetical protein
MKSQYHLQIVHALIQGPKYQYHLKKIVNNGGSKTDTCGSTSTSECHNDFKKSTAFVQLYVEKFIQTFRE